MGNCCIKSKDKKEYEEHFSKIYVLRTMSEIVS